MCHMLLAGEGNMDTPSKQLADKIMDRLITEGYMSPDDRKKLLSKLADGKLKPEDWRLAVELSGSRTEAKE